MDETITFNRLSDSECHSQKTQTEPQKYIILFNETNTCLESVDKKIENKLYFFSSFQEITVGGFVNQLIKKLWPKCVKSRNCPVNL